MVLSYKQKATKLNNAAKYFAALGYHVTTSFLSKWGGMEVTVFFHRTDEIESLQSLILLYKDEDDIITVEEYSRDNGSRYYTISLQK